MEKLNVALVGCGRIADLHIQGYKKNRNARIYAVCDINPDIAKARKREWKAVKSYTDYSELLADNKIDAVEILTPQTLHEDMVLDAIEAGKHIALQKPMTINISSANRILKETQNKTKTRDFVFKITENYVFYPPIVLAKKMITSGDIGDPLHVRIKFIGGPTGGWKVPESAWQWRIQEAREKRGPITFDHGHHLWSTAWYLLGKIEKVHAWIDSIDGISDSPASVMWKYKNKKAYGVSDISQTNSLNIPSKYYSNDEWIEITGQRGIIFIHRCTGNIHKGPALSFFNGRSIRHFNPKSDWAEGFKGATDNFIKAIRGQAAPMLSADDGKEILKYAIAVRKSSDLNRTVYIDELEKTFPGFYYFRQKRNELEKKHLFRFFKREKLTKYAPQALQLTEELVKKFNPEKAKGLDTIIGIHLTLDGGIEEKLGLYIKNCKIKIKKDGLPDHAVLTIFIPSGTWAGILLGKKRIETALLQRELKFKGKAEEGLKLKAVFEDL
jgi:predicted dehydrogenase